MLTNAELKYIKLVYEFEESGLPLVGPQNIAQKLNITRASVHEALIRLTKKGFLEHFPRKGFRLTKLGKKVAKRLIRNHRVIETMFVELVGLSLEEACKCASLIEFRFSEEVIEKIYVSLGCPERCPHGKPIPNIEDEYKAIEE